MAETRATTYFDSRRKASQLMKQQATEMQTGCDHTVRWKQMMTLTLALSSVEHQVTLMMLPSEIIF